jgi:predicted negative regulator of RcsB-dependent stress response
VEIIKDNNLYLSHANSLSLVCLCNSSDPGVSLCICQLLPQSSQSTMSGNKAALKAAKVALDAENYDDAVTQCQIVLASDSQNYFAYVIS